MFKTAYIQTTSYATLIQLRVVRGFLTVLTLRRGNHSGIRTSLNFEFELRNIIGGEFVGFEKRLEVRKRGCL